MKICLSATGPDLKATIDPRFGRCKYLLFVDSESGEIVKSMENKNTGAMRGAGITTAQVVADEGTEVIITGNIGPNAFGVLKSTGIKIYTGVFGVTVKEALEKFKKGEFKEGTAPLGPGGSNQQAGSGMGRGSSSGQGARKGMGR